MFGHGNSHAPVPNRFHHGWNRGNRAQPVRYGGRSCIVAGHEQHGCERQDGHCQYGNIGRPERPVGGVRLAADEEGDRRDLDVYICGLKEMVNDVRDRCKELGFDKKQVIYERYD